MRNYHNFSGKPAPDIQSLATRVLWGTTKLKYWLHLMLCCCWCLGSLERTTSNIGLVQPAELCWPVSWTDQGKDHHFLLLYLLWHLCLPQLCITPLESLTIYRQLKDSMALLRQTQPLPRLPPAQPQEPIKLFEPPPPNPYDELNTSVLEKKLQ